MTTELPRLEFPLKLRPIPAYGLRYQHLLPGGILPAGIVAKLVRMGDRVLVGLGDNHLECWLRILFGDILSNPVSCEPLLFRLVVNALLLQLLRIIL